MEAFTDPAVEAWFRDNTYRRQGLEETDLLELKEASGTSVTVCLPALNEEATIGAICEAISQRLVRPGLVDALVVIDSGSADATREVSHAAGADVFRATEILPDSGPGVGGKGESLWKSLAVIDSDIVLWLDSDTRNFDPVFVTALLGPLLQDPDLLFVKGYYERPLATDGTIARAGGGRVTELGIRPLLNLLHPMLTGFIQPLSGEYGGRREALLDVPFRTGYDVDVVLLVDLVERFGIDALGQADLGRREHRNRDIDALGLMSFEVMRGLLMRLEELGRIKTLGELPASLVRFMHERDGWQPHPSTSVAHERPPMRSLLH